MVFRISKKPKPKRMVKSGPSHGGGVYSNGGGLYSNGGGLYSNGGGLYSNNENSKSGLKKHFAAKYASKPYLDVITEIISNFCQNFECKNRRDLYKAEL